MSVFDVSHNACHCPFRRRGHWAGRRGGDQGGGGGETPIENCPDVCGVSENEPILNDTLSCETYPY